MKSPFSTYTLKARIQPALLTVLPLGVVLLAWSPGDSLPAGALWSLVTAAGGTAFLAQWGRDKGRNKQSALWNKWGGAPTTQLLRFRDNPNPELLSRRRARLEQLVGRKLPTAEEEKRDTAKADLAYGSAVAYLLEATRDADRFPLILEENINYGFRRNLWGLKPYGVIIAVLGVIGTWALLWLELFGRSVDLSFYLQLTETPDTLLIFRLIGALVNTIILGIWLILLKPQWIRLAADAYADRLIGSVDSL